MIRRMMMASLNSSASPPSDTYELTIVINGLDDEYEVAVNGEVWPNNKKSFVAGTILQNLVVTVVGYDIDPPIVSEVIMDANKTLTFEATSSSSDIILNGATRIQLPDPPFVKTGNNYSTSNQETYFAGSIVGDGFGAVRMINSIGCSLYFTEFADGSGAAVGFYAYGDVVYRDDGNSDAPTPIQPLEGEYIALLKQSNQIGIYTTMDGIDFELLYDFGAFSLDNIIIGTIVSNKIFDPQIKGVII